MNRSAVPVIAIDGPSGSGKGTIAALVAERLGWHLLDSGALYRIVALVALERGIDLGDAEALAAAARGLALRFGDGGRIWVDGTERSDEIRTEAVSEASSRVAALQPVRDAILEVQRAQRRAPGLVADGRDMGTVIFPDAAAKIFLTASAEARALRRHKQLNGKENDASLTALFREISARDERDANRKTAPLRPADDAVVIDTTELDVPGVMERVLEVIRERCPEAFQSR